MIFHKIFIEEEVWEHPRTLYLLKRVKSKEPPRKIRKIEDWFERYRKPYLQKRDHLNLYIGKKLGQLVKEAPVAYGLSGNPHYYFIYNYNCPYECKYCYLQGHFSSPDFVFFVNYEDVADSMEKIICSTPDDKTPWFHAGEFSDSLALSHLTHEWPFFFDFFAKWPKARMELRTKSANVRELLKLHPSSNITISFSLAPDRQISLYDLKTPPLKARIEAIRLLADKGYQIGWHFDPVFYYPEYEDEYGQLIDKLLKVVPEDQLDYISLGVVRFTKDVWRAVQYNYPDLSFGAEMVRDRGDGKVRYPHVVRNSILNDLKELCIRKGIEVSKVYLCMEDSGTHLIGPDEISIR